MRARVTFRDPKLPHQIRLDFVKGSGMTKVSCNCKRQPLGYMYPDGNAWAIFNDVHKHNNTQVQFVPGQSTAKVMNVE